jgi:PhnB protein
MRLAGGDGRIGHAELTLHGAKFMLADEYPEIDCMSPLKRGGPSCSFSLQVDEVDAFSARAVSGGARLERPIKDEFYGERVAWIRDPFGHRWSFHEQLEAVSTETVKQRFDGLDNA